MGTVGSRRVAAATLAGGVAAVDLLEKTFDADALHHPRSLAALALMAGVTAGLLTVVPRVPSWPVTAGAGVAAGGAIGNLLSGILWWGSGVPDPLVVRWAAGAIAFNLADVFVLTGDALLLTSATVYALRNRARLRQPV